jgi:hypothetical protein
MISDIECHLQHTPVPCGCRPTASCPYCPAWKVAAQRRYEKEVVPERRQPLYHAAWRPLYDRFGWQIVWARGAEPANFASHLEAVSGGLLRYKARQMWWILSTGMMAGAALAVHSLSRGVLWWAALALAAVSCSGEALGYAALCVRFVRRLARGGVSTRTVPPGGSAP